MNAIKHILLHVLVFAHLMVIFSFSSMPAKQSAAKSREILSPIVEIAATTVYKDSVKVPTLVKGRIHYLIRKSAHMLNFFILGFLLTFLFCFSYTRNGYVLATLAFLSGVICAVVDEGTQLFIEGRGAKLTDVFWDMSGVIIGLILFFILLKLFYKEREVRRMVNEKIY